MFLEGAIPAGASEGRKHPCWTLRQHICAQRLSESIVAVPSKDVPGAVKHRSCLGTLSTSVGRSACKGLGTGLDQAGNKPRARTLVDHRFKSDLTSDLPLRGPQSQSDSRWPQPLRSEGKSVAKMFSAPATRAPSGFRSLQGLCLRLCATGQFGTGRSRCGPGQRVYILISSAYYNIDPLPWPWSSQTLTGLGSGRVQSLSVALSGVSVASAVQEGLGGISYSFGQAK